MRAKKMEEREKLEEEIDEREKLEEEAKIQKYEQISSKKMEDEAFQNLISTMVDHAEKKVREYELKTIEKNIRDGIYNKPKLVFVNSPQGRHVGLPIWNSNRYSDPDTKIPNLSELKVHVPTELLEKIKLADQAKLKNDFDETVSFILTKGLSILSPEIKKGLMKQLDSLDL